MGSSWDFFEPGNGFQCAGIGVHPTASTYFLAGDQSGGSPGYLMRVDDDGSTSLSYTIQEALNFEQTDGSAYGTFDIVTVVDPNSSREFMVTVPLNQSQNDILVSNGVDGAFWRAVGHTEEPNIWGMTSGQGAYKTVDITTTGAIITGDHLVRLD